MGVQKGTTDILRKYGKVYSNGKKLKMYMTWIKTFISTVWWNTYQIKCVLELLCDTWRSKQLYCVETGRQMYIGKKQQDQRTWKRVLCKLEKSIYGLKQTPHIWKRKKKNQCYLKSDSHKAKLMPDTRTRDRLRSWLILMICFAVVRVKRITKKL